MKAGLALLLLLLCFSCKKDAEVNYFDYGCGHRYDPDNERYYQGIQPDRLWVPVYDGLRVTSPCFNPRNAEEYVAIETSDGADSLVLYNFRTGVRRGLADRALTWSPPSWSTKNCIAFARSDGQLWLVSPSGDSLRQVTNSGQSFYPEWSPDGQRMVAVYDATDDGFRGFVIRDESGTLVDTVWNGRGAYRATWSPDGSKLCDRGASWFELSNPKDLHIYGHADQSTRGPSRTNHDWTWDSGTIVWTGGDGNLYQTQLFTGESTLVASPPDCVSYGFFSTSPTDNTILLSEYASIVIDPSIKFPDSALVRSRLVLLDLDTGSKTVVLE